MKILERVSLSFSFMLISFFSAGNLCAQEAMGRKPIAFSAGMGVSYVNASDVVDFVNQFTATSGRESDFSTAVEFFAAPEVALNSNLGLKLEYAYLFKQYTVTGSLPGRFEFSYHAHMPTGLLFYTIEGEGFFVKFGGGLGYHFGKFTRLDPNSGSESRFSGNGLGFKLEVVGNTAFGESLYGVIGGDLRLDFIGRLKDGAGRGLEILKISGANDPVDLHFVSFGIKFGLIYYF